MALNTKPILEVRGLTTLLGGGGGMLQRQRPPVRAVEDVSFTLHPGEIFGIVGESGSGKTTLGRTVVGILREAAGEIFLQGKCVSGLDRRAARQVRHNIQYVHQDTGAALNPWWSIGRSITEPMVIHRIGTKAEQTRKVDAIMAAVGLASTFKRRYPHELSGGQLRRVALARVLVLSPRIVILDEPTSGLDLSVQATVLELLKDLRENLGLGYLFISHDLAVIRHICDRVAIMQRGRIVEQGDVQRIFTAPSHPYTKTLLAASPRLKPGQLHEPLPAAKVAD